MFRTFALVTLMLAAACSRPEGPAPDGPLVIGASAVPHAEVLAFVEPMVEARGVQLSVRVFDDYIQPNTWLADGRLDANYFQTAAYMAEFNRSHEVQLVALGAVHVEPLGAYSSRHQDLADLPREADVAIPDGLSNRGRALLLLQKAGLIRLRDPEDPLSGLDDIIDNPLALDIREVEASILPRVLDQVDLAVINTNYALAADLNPRVDALVLEDGASLWANLLVTRADNRDDPRLAVLIEALRSPDTQAFIERRYRGAVLPAE